MDLKVYYESDELKHYGVLGMKWGVRRYQNYDGSYTQKGVSRYRKAESDYNNAKDTAKRTKASYKSGTATKQEYKTAKQQIRAEKRNMKKAYSKLKTDKMADEGKKLYKSGKTITDNTMKNAYAQAAIVAGSRVASYIISSKTGNTKVAALSSYAIAAGGTAVNAMLAVKTSSENKKLRAYYGH